MSNATRCYDPQGITRFLEGRLAADEQLQFENHLDTCPACRDRLETSAAERKYWTDAAIYLPDDPIDSELEKESAASIDDSQGPTPDEKINALRIADFFDPTDDPRMLGRFGGYEIVGVIGCGGMGIVLKGFETALNRYVAIKALAPHLAASGAARARFAREACAAAAVLHENVVAIHRVSEAKGLPYLVMPYIPGDSLQKRLDARGPLETNEILRIGMQIAAGLAAAHAQGLIHRDIKPENILLDNGVERVTITDFGLARTTDDASLTLSGVIAGTPQYMSPEQARGEMLDARSDLFSLGSVLYALCAGRPPFREQTVFGVLRRIMESTPTPIREIVPEVPDWLCEIIAKLHAKAPSDRFQSAAELADLLGRWLTHIQQPTLIPSPPRIGLRKRRMRKFRPVAAALGITAAIVASTIAVLPYLRTNDAKKQPAPQATATYPTMNAEELRKESILLQPILNEKAIREDCQTIQLRAARLETEWSQSSPAISDTLEATAAELRREADSLSNRIDRNLP